MRMIYKFYLNIEQIVNVSVVWSEACSYHTVHGKVIVLCLKLHCMRVTGSDLRVAVQKQTFVVCDPIKHLQENIKERKKKKITNLLWQKSHSNVRNPWTQKTEFKAMKINTDALSILSYCIF